MGSEVTEDRVREIVNGLLAECRADMDERINLTHADVSELRDELHGFRSEFNQTTGQMTDHLAKIAVSIEKLADLPEAWANFKGFMSFMKWLKDYWFVFVIGGAAVLGSIYLTAKSIGLV